MTEYSPLGLTGHDVEGYAPDWGPLLHVLEVDCLVGWFMWMYELELENGVRVHAYKHQTTRRYLHLDADGNAYRYHGGARLSDQSHYAPASLAGVLEDTLAFWWDDVDSDEESIVAARAAIDRARDRLRASRAAGASQDG